MVIITVHLANVRLEERVKTILPDLNLKKIKTYLNKFFMFSGWTKEYLLIFASTDPPDTQCTSYLNLSTAWPLIDLLPHPHTWRKRNHCSSSSTGNILTLMKLIPSMMLMTVEELL